MPRRCTAQRPFALLHPADLSLVPKGLHACSTCKCTASNALVLLMVSP